MMIVSLPARPGSLPGDATTRRKGPVAPGKLPRALGLTTGLSYPTYKGLGGTWRVKDLKSVSSEGDRQHLTSCFAKRDCAPLLGPGLSRPSLRGRPAMVGVAAPWVQAESVLLRTDLGLHRVL
ncbi:hypothetical protein ACJJTC_017699 [Scirpophaga incertulas]